MQPRNDGEELTAREDKYDEKNIIVFRNSIETAGKGWSPQVLNDASPIVNNFKFAGKTAGANSVNEFFVSVTLRPNEP